MSSTLLESWPFRAAVVCLLLQVPLIILVTLGYLHEDRPWWTVLLMFIVLLLWALSSLFSSLVLQSRGYSIWLGLTSLANGLFPLLLCILLPAKPKAEVKPDPFRDPAG